MVMLLGSPYQQTDVVSHLKDTSLICCCPGQGACLITLLDATGVCSMCRVPGDAEALELVFAMSPALMFCQLDAILCCWHHRVHS